MFTTNTRAALKFLDGVIQDVEALVTFLLKGLYMLMYLVVTSIYDGYMRSDFYESLYLLIWRLTKTPWQH